MSHSDVSVLLEAGDMAVIDVTQELAASIELADSVMRELHHIKSVLSVNTQTLWIL